MLERRLNQNIFKDDHFRLRDEDGQFDALFQLNTLTANRTYTLQDDDGTLALVSDLAAYLPLVGGTMTGDINMGANNISNIGTLTAAGLDLTAPSATGTAISRHASGGLQATRYSDDASGANWFSYRAGGTSDTPLWCNNNDTIMALQGFAYDEDGSYFAGSVARIKFMAADDHSATGLPTKIVFGVTPSNDAGAADELVLTSSALAPVADSGLSLGTPTERFNNSFIETGDFNLLYVDNVIINGNTISTSSGNLTITAAGGAISFGNENLTTTGTITTNGLDVTGVTSDVSFFDDELLGDGVNGHSLYLRRHASEGDSYIRLYNDSYLNAQLKSSGDFLFYPGGHMRILVLDGKSYKFECANATGTATLRQYGYITAASAQKYISFTVDDTDDYYKLERQDANILGFKVLMPTELGGASDHTSFSATGNVLLPAGAAGAGKYPIKFQAGTALDTDEPGVINYIDDGSDNNTGRFCITNVATCRVIDRTSNVLLESITVENTDVKTLVWTGPMPANSLRAGNVFKFFGRGEASSTGNGQLTISIEVNDVEVISITSSERNLDEDDVHIDAMATQRTLTDEAIAGERAVHLDLAVGSDSTHYEAIAQIDTEDDMDVKIYAKWSAANVANIFSLYQAFMEFKN